VLQRWANILQFKHAYDCPRHLQVSWEETTEAAMTHLLRSCLARSAKDAAAAVPPLAPAPDTARLKKHISLVLERLSKGMRLAGVTSGGGSSNSGGSAASVAVH
jgi:Bardet-Biedl syndrome 9 protein